MLRLALSLGPGRPRLGVIEVSAQLIAVSLAAAVVLLPHPLSAQEVPGRPAAPTVTGGREQVEIDWVAPSNAGPAISDYDVWYRIRDVEVEFTDAGYDGTGTSFTIVGLQRGKWYQVQVRARNADGPGDWSPSGEGRTHPNRAPGFVHVEPTHELSVDEGKESGDPVGEPYTATDGDGDEVSYTLSEEDAGVFTVDGGGQIRVAEGFSLDYESPADANGDNTYIVEVVADDGHQGRDTISLTIEVDNTDEPGAVHLTRRVPRVGEEIGATLSDPDGNVVNVTWRWQRSEATATPPWVDIDGATSETYKTLAADQGKMLRAVADYTDGEGSGKTAVSAATSAVRVRNRAPTFSSATMTRSVSESAQPGDPVGEPLIATDRDGDSLRGSLSSSSGLFDISWSYIGSSKTSLQLRVGDDGGLDYEADPLHLLRVRADDGRGGRGTVTVTVEVADVNEPPARPDSPAVSGSGQSLFVSWSPPDNWGPPITRYGVRYRPVDSDPFIDSGYVGEATSTTISGLARGQRYQVQVRAINEEGESDWSESTEAVTEPNGPPSFQVGPTTTLHVPEDRQAGGLVGEPIVISDPEQDALTVLLLHGGPRSFDLATSATDEATFVQLRLGDGVELDHETTPSHVARMVARDAHGGEANLIVVIAVADVEEPPSRPDAPSVEAGAERLFVSWSEPANRGPPIAHYDVRYRPSGSGQSFTTSQMGAETKAVISDLEPGRRYLVQVRAVTDEGRSRWSRSGTGTPKPRPVSTPESGPTAAAPGAWATPIPAAVVVAAPEAGATLTLPADAIAGTARVDYDVDPANCTDEPPPGKLEACIRLEVVDSAGGRARVGPIAPAKLGIRLSPARMEELGGPAVALYANSMGGFMLLARSGPGEPWIRLFSEFSIDGEGGVTISSSRARDLGDFALTTAPAIFEAVKGQMDGDNPNRAPSRPMPDYELPATGGALSVGPRLLLGLVVAALLLISTRAVLTRIGRRCAPGDPLHEPQQGGQVEHSPESC